MKKVFTQPFINKQESTNCIDLFRHGVEIFDDDITELIINGIVKQINECPSTLTASSALFVAQVI